MKKRVHERAQDPSLAPEYKPKSATAPKPVVTYTGNLFSSKINERIGLCKWLIPNSVWFSSLLEEVSLSIAIDEKLTLELLGRNTTDSKDVYWELPSLLIEADKYNENIESEFSIIKGLMLSEACGVCGKFEFYVNIKQTRGLDEAATVESICATCNPRR